MKITLFLRKKIPGENSIEELAYQLERHVEGLSVCLLPEYGNTIRGIVRNGLCARRHAGDVNVIFSPSEVGIVPFLRGPKVLVWHDVATAFRTQNPLKRWIKMRLFRWGASLCDVNSCISAFTLRELDTFCPRIGRTAVLHNPYDERIVYSPKAFDEACPTILHIGTGPRKNLERVIEALSGMPVRLAIVGRLSERQRQLLAEHGIDYSNCSDVGFETIVALYRACDAVSFPSLYEGFGMPVVEAQATGRVVVASPSGAIPEVAGDSVRYVDPHDVENIREGFRAVIGDAALRDALIEKGRANAAKYAVRRIVGEYEALFRDLTGRHSARRP